MSTPRNESIGTVECPCKGCSEVCEVFRYRERGAGERSIANRRFAGKLYGRCSKHGRFGGDAGDDAMQDYILSNATIVKAGSADPHPGKARPIKPQSQNVRAEPPRPQKPFTKPRRASVTIDEDDEPQSEGFGFFR